MPSAAFWTMVALLSSFVSCASSLPGRSTAGWQWRRHGREWPDSCGRLTKSLAQSFARAKSNPDRPRQWVSLKWDCIRLCAAKPAFSSRSVLSLGVAKAVARQGYVDRRRRLIRALTVRNSSRSRATAISEVVSTVLRCACVDKWRSIRRISRVNSAQSVVVAMGACYLHRLMRAVPDCTPAP